MKKLITIITLILCFHKFNAQNHDLGILVGTLNLQTDHGQAENFFSFITDSGTSLSIAYYLSFYNNTSRWNPHKRTDDHLRIKAEFKHLSNGNFKHVNWYAKKNNSNGEKLRAMKGSIEMFDLGLNLEYFLFSLKESRNKTFLNPFFSFGFKYSFYTNTITSELGNWEEDRALLADWFSYQTKLNPGTGKAFSLCTGFGIICKWTSKIDIVTQLSTQYFLSDSVDGLINNKNDSSLNIEFGITYHLSSN